MEALQRPKNGLHGLSLRLKESVGCVYTNCGTDMVVRHTLSALVYALAYARLRSVHHGIITHK